MKCDPQKRKDKIGEIMKSKKYIRRTWLAGLFALPALVVLYLIIVYGSNIPIWDEWKVVRYYRDTLQNGFSLSRLLGYQNNEHRIPVPVFFQTIIWSLSRCNNIIISITAQGCLLVALAVIIANWRRQGLPAGVLLPIAPLIFSLCQGMMQFWTSCFHWSLLVLFAVLSFYFYDAFEKKKKLRLLFFTVFFGILANFSAANGLLLWVAYAVIFLAQKIFEKKPIFRDGKYIILICGIICWVLYFHGWNGTTKSMNASDIFQLFQALVFVVSNPLSKSAEPWVSYFIGSVVISAFIFMGYYLCMKKRITQCVFQSLIAVFFFGSVVLVAFGRAGLAVDLSDIPNVTGSSQYSVMPVWLLVSCYVLGIRMLLIKIPHERYKQAITEGALFLYALMFCLSIGKIDMVWSHKNLAQACAYTVQHYTEVPDTMKTTYIYPAICSGDFNLNEEVDWIRDNGLFLFAHDKRYEYPYDDYVIAELDRDFKLPERGMEPEACCVDTVNGNPVQEPGITITSDVGINIRGWALNDSQQAPPSAVYAEIAGRYYLLKFESRTDVAQAYGNMAYVDSGFHGYVSTQNLGPGHYQADLIVISADEGSYYTVPIVSVEIV